MRKYKGTTLRTSEGGSFVLLETKSSAAQTAFHFLSFTYYRLPFQLTVEAVLFYE